MNWFKIVLGCAVLGLISFASPAAAAPPNVTLVSPDPDAEFTASDSVAFSCNASDDPHLWNLSLYHNISGVFALNQTTPFGEFANDSNTLLLCHFNGGYTCADGEAGESTGTSFEAGKFRQGVLVDDSDILNYSTSGNFDREQGTIEFWVKPYPNVFGGRYGFFSGGGENWRDPNDFGIYYRPGANGVVSFELIDSGGGAHYVTKSISGGWQAGEWHHVAAVWDLDGDVSGTYNIELYIDGSNVTDGWTYQYAENTIIMDATSATMYVGSLHTATTSGIYRANGTIDEFRISSVPKTPSEINQSYWKGLKNYTDESANWTVAGIPDGRYVWSCLAHDNGSESSWGVNRSFLVDTNPPTASNVLITPNSTDDVDPGVTINVTANVTDVTDVDTVILQWKETAWNNETMNGTGGNYNASFDIDPTGGTYYYRIWANDTFGHANTSSTYNVSAEPDYSWTWSPLNFGTVSGYINSVGQVGNLTINNTGDDLLSFDLSHNWLLDVYFNVTLPFALAKKTSIDINVSAQFASSDGVNSMIITITPSHGSETPSPTSATVNATVETYSGGPYLVTTITGYNTSVYQSQTFNLSASVKNIGNETATGTWLNWTLPAGWENVSGELNRYIGDVNSSKTELNDITVTIDASSGTTGIRIINASASCTENLSSYDSEFVAVSCSNTDGICGLGCSSSTDTDCPTPSGSTSPRIVELPLPTAYSPTPAQRKDVLNVEEIFEVVRGKESSFEVSVTNPFENSTIEDLGLAVSGPLSRYIKVRSRGTYGEIKIEFASEPTEEGLGYNETRTYEVTVATPTYTDKGTYPLNLTITGNVSYTDYPASVSERTGRVLEYRNITFAMVETKIINLAVHIISRDEGDAAVEGGITDMGYMQNAGFSTKRINRLLEAARIAMARGDYEAARKISEEIVRIKEAAFSARDAIYKLQNMIRDAEEVKGLKIPETKELLSLTLAAFEREDYETALQRANDAELVYSSETRGKINYAKMLLDNLAAVIVGAGAFMVVGIVSFNRASAVIAARRLEALDVNEINIMGLMRESQENYYLKKTLSPAAYKDAMDEYTKRMTEIKSKRAKLKAKRAAMIGASEELKGLKKEGQNLEELIRDAQDRYYNRRAMSKREYNESMEHYTARHVEIEEAITVLEMKVSK